jgi:hypothetical protein
MICILNENAIRWYAIFIMLMDWQKRRLKMVGIFINSIIYFKHSLKDELFQYDK